MYTKLYQDLCRTLEESGRGYDIEKIKRAYHRALVAHGDQKRVSGEPYIIHPLHVAFILVELGMDTACICAALMHDVVEDTPVTLEEVRGEFGSEIALLVDGVTKLGKIPLTTTSKEEQQAENVRKMLLAMSQDIRVIIIKLADRLHNMRTLQYMREDKQLTKSLETMEIYAPIANRLGIMAVKEELEDLSLHYLDPVACKEIEEVLRLRSNGREAIIESIKQRILDRLKEYHIEAPHIEGRVKSMYGIYRKVYMAGRSFDEVYDIYAVRVIVNTDIECYNILGIIHDMFTPIPNRFKDYISTPKPNMYQSLHTTVLGKEGIPFEIQIRTWAMHYTAEYGIAAHWKYKEGIRGKDKLEDRLSWIRQMLEAQKESEGAEDIVRTIKTDLTPEEIYAFTPKGDVKCLPAGSTVIDFAYAIHSEVGNKMIGAKADGRIVSLEYKVKNGQIIEILTTKSVTHGPNKEWLNIAKTSEARSKIRSWFKRERREENIVEGKIELDKELKKNNIRLDEEQYQQLVERLCKRYGHDEDDLYAAIGYGGIVLAKIMPNLKEEYAKKMKRENEENELIAPITTKPKLTGDVEVEGVDNCLVKFSQCCNPLPGDDIIGFITRGHGVSVHKRDCINVVNSMKDPEQAGRWIGVRWTGDVEKEYNCTLDIVAHDRDKLFVDISLALANLRVPIHEISGRQLKNGNASVVVTIGLQGTEHLKNIMQKLSKVNGVISVERSGK
jgi:guanosine-3',5'-bis(diphosphate) 3'-pyrophosphohydrolase